jgi:hypothetical protein
MLTPKGQSCQTVKNAKEKITVLLLLLLCVCVCVCEREREREKVRIVVPLLCKEASSTQRCMCDGLGEGHQSENMPLS